MMRLGMLTGILCVGLGQIYAGDAAPAWEALNLPEAAAGKALLGVWFLPDGKHGWIVGEKGLCLATADGGTTWAEQKTGSGATLRDVRFLDEKRGWAVGEGDPAGPQPRGHVVMMPGMQMKSATCLTTEDGGATWTNHWVPSNFQIWCVEPAAVPAVQIGNSGGEQHLDGDNFRSADGGKTFRSERVFRAVFDVRRVDGDKWALVGSPVSVGFMPTPTSPLYTNRGCRALFSADGGKSWQISKGTETLKGRACLRRMAFKAGQPLIAVGDKGAVATSADAGQTWKTVEAPLKQDLRGAAYAGGEGGACLAVGRKGAVLFSPDAGATWKAVPFEGEADLFAVAACGSDFVAVSGAGVALKLAAAKLP
ncbi:MAG: YCF48-related protein [Planctomycetota bacterium]|nr:YCF48-related protein [Planctomycetota bacterium]